VSFRMKKRARRQGRSRPSGGEDHFRYVGAPQNMPSRRRGEGEGGAADCFRNPGILLDSGGKILERKRRILGRLGEGEGTIKKRRFVSYVREKKVSERPKPGQLSYVGPLPTEGRRRETRMGKVREENTT